MSSVLDTFVETVGKPLCQYRINGIEVFFCLNITMVQKMDDTLQLIGVLVPKFLTEPSSKEVCLPCSSICLEGFNELFRRFDELFYALSSIFL